MKTTTTQVYFYENKQPSDFLTRTHQLEITEKVTKSEYVRTGDRVESFESKVNKSLVLNDLNNSKKTVIDVKIEKSNSNGYVVEEHVTYEPQVIRQPLFLTASEIHNRIRNAFLDSFLSLNRKESILDSIDQLTKKVFDSSKDVDTVEIRMPNGRYLTFDWDNFRFALPSQPTPVEWVTTKRYLTYK